MDNIDWQCRSFKELAAPALYEIMALRQNIFIVEQKSPCFDMDYNDHKASHLMGFEKSRLAAYARIFPPGAHYPEAVIGRVAVLAEFRKSGLGTMLMRQAMARIEATYGDVPIRISAQAHLAEKFYKNLGFRCFGGVYDEDGIPHIGMIFRAKEFSPVDPLSLCCPR